MRRRAMIRSLGAAAVVGGAGCMGGGEVEEQIQRSARIRPGEYWSAELPDISDTGGSISYIARAERPFDVYFFTLGGNFTSYREVVEGESSGPPPTGHEEFSKTATPTDGGETFEAATEDGGSRQTLTEDGPYYFVLDHTAYGVGARPGDPGEELTVSLEVTLIRSRGL